MFLFSKSLPVSRDVMLSLMRLCTLICIVYSKRLPLARTHAFSRIYTTLVNVQDGSKMKAVYSGRYFKKVGPFKTRSSATS